MCPVRMRNNRAICQEAATTTTTSAVCVSLYPVPVRASPMGGLSVAQLASLCCAGVARGCSRWNERGWSLVSLLRARQSCGFLRKVFSVGISSFFYVVAVVVRWCWWMAGEGQWTLPSGRINLELRIVGRMCFDGFSSSRFSRKKQKIRT